MKGLVFDTENRMQFKDFGEPLLDNLQKEVGGCIEVVHPKYLPEGLCMVIDDEGLLKALLQAQTELNVIYHKSVNGDVYDTGTFVQEMRNAIHPILNIKQEDTDAE